MAEQVEIPNTLAEETSTRRFQFFKGAEDIFSGIADSEFDWKQSALKTREQLGNAMNARHLSFLFGSGCSTFCKDDTEVGIPTMAPLAEDFLASGEKKPEKHYPTKIEADALQNTLGIDIRADEFLGNLERLMEVLFSAQFVLKRSSADTLKSCLDVVDSLIKKITRFVCERCGKGEFNSGDDTVVKLYQAFYRRLIFRDR